MCVYVVRYICIVCYVIVFTYLFSITFTLQFITFIILIYDDLHSVSMYNLVLVRYYSTALTITL